MLSLIKLPRVLTISQVPKVFHEDGIISGYRYPYSTAKDCVLSVFQLTNETLNIWTHFLPTWFFLWKLLVVLVEGDWQDCYRWPLVVFLFSSCLYPLASSCAHTFSTMSERARHICFFFDYGALSFYSLGLIGICFQNNKPFKPFTLNAESAVRTNVKLGKCLRTVAFAYPYIFDSVPLLCRMFVCSGDGCTVNEATAVHYLHTALAIFTGFLFATHLPERLAPGSFDYIGHSHQLFHVFAIIGTYFQLTAIELDMTLRKQWLQTHSQPITFTNTLGAALLCVTSCLCIIHIFIQELFTTTKNDNHFKRAQITAVSHSQ
ncbi:hypothetical protein P4O66_018348 [Electrophorus voltai]|uniref:Progestin and adipoQ receptor family member VI n=1 Tax=Electrophorus voltai TaxID=2609070 RepID=A0AAD9DJL4_9TELE|nr:hypothetical protein P4O66_018348 [Electrophorus voltai]